MKIQCDCGQFTAELINCPQESPGRIVCYCDDCQNYLKIIKREDLLDPYGGIEIIPVYPTNYHFLSGIDKLKCLRLTSHGLYRWYTHCCNSPIGNTTTSIPWVGIFHNAFKLENNNYLEVFGPVKSRVMGHFKTKETPFKVSNKLSLKDILVVCPFILKGLIKNKKKGSPFFKKDNSTPIIGPEIISKS